MICPIKSQAGVETRIFTYFQRLSILINDENCHVSQSKLNLEYSTNWLTFPHGAA